MKVLSVINMVWINMKFLRVLVFLMHILSWWDFLLSFLPVRIWRLYIPSTSLLRCEPVTRAQLLFGVTHYFADVVRDFLTHVSRRQRES